MPKKPRDQPKANVKAQTKICAACGKPFSNRKRWQSRGIWQEVRFCSERCRRENRH